MVAFLGLTGLGLITITHAGKKKFKLKIFHSRGDDENDKFEKKLIEHVADTNTCSGTTAGNVNACVHM